MKKIIILLVILSFGVGAFQLASHIYRYEFFDLAIQFEKDRANLITVNTRIEENAYYFLTRPSQAEKETVILLHGFSADKENWLRFAQHLPEHFQIFALDLLGHGQHAIDLSRNYSIENQVAYLATFISQYVNQKVHLVGNSMGGAVAALYSAEHQEQVKSLMLISPAGIHDIPSQMDNLLASGENPLIANSIEQFYDVIDFVMEDPPFIPAAILDIQAEKSVARYDLNQKIFKDIRADLSKQLDQKFTDIRSPTFILWGREDRVINAENAQRYHSLIPHSDYQLLDGIGHLAMLEAPKKSTEMFKNLVKEHSLTTN